MEYRHAGVWPDDPRKANALVLDAFIDIGNPLRHLIVALWAFLEAFFLWCLYTLGPQLWAACRAIWRGALAIRWGVPRMWRQLTIPPAALPGLEKARAEELAKLSFNLPKEADPRAFDMQVENHDDFADRIAVPIPPIEEVAKLNDDEWNTEETVDAYVKAAAATGFSVGDLEDEANEI